MSEGPSEMIGKSEMFFDQFKLSPRIAVLYDKMRAYLGENPQRSGEAFVDTSRHFSAALFEEIAFHTLQKTTSPHELLSPEETYEYFHNELYPQAQPIPHSFANGLRGISVPDGISFETQNGKKNVVSICEYTTRRKGLRYVKHKCESFLKLKRDYPELFNHAHLTFITTTCSLLGSDINVLGFTDTNVVKLPFSRIGFQNMAKREIAKLT